MSRQPKYEDFLEYGLISLAVFLMFFLGLWACDILCGWVGIQKKEP